MTNSVLKQILKSILWIWLAIGHAAAHADAASKHKDEKRAFSIEEKAFGREGDPQKITRTIHIGMTDAMRYSPMQIIVKRGQTVRFIAKNSGEVMHEMVLGTMPELKAHSELMKQFPDMQHDEPHMVHVKPGKTGHMVWQFTKAGEFYYACLMPGHFEAGMIGTVIVK